MLIFQGVNPFFITKGMQRKNQKRPFFSTAVHPQRGYKAIFSEICAQAEKNKKTSAWPMNGMVMPCHELIPKKNPCMIYLPTWMVDVYGKCR